MHVNLLNDGSTEGQCTTLKNMLDDVVSILISNKIKNTIKNFFENWSLGRSEPAWKDQLLSALPSNIQVISG